MKERELRSIAECALCHKPFGHTGLPLFWRVRIERHGVNMVTVRRQDGLAQFLGDSFLANVMGADEEMTTQPMEPVSLTLCECCAMGMNTIFMMLVEAANEQTKKKHDPAARQN